MNFDDLILEGKRLIRYYRSCGCNYRSMLLVIKKKVELLELQKKFCNEVLESKKFFKLYMRGNIYYSLLQDVVDGEYTKVRMSLKTDDKEWAKVLITKREYIYNPKIFLKQLSFDDPLYFDEILVDPSENKESYIVLGGHILKLGNVSDSFYPELFIKSVNKEKAGKKFPA